MSQFLIPDIANADEVAASGTSAQFSTLSMDSSQARGHGLYRYCANVATWIAQGSDPTASAGSGSMFVPAGSEVILDGRDGVKLAVIDDGTAGKASLVPLRRE